MPLTKHLKFTQQKAQMKKVDKLIHIEGDIYCHVQAGKFDEYIFIWLAKKMPKHWFWGVDYKENIFTTRGFELRLNAEDKDCGISVTGGINGYIKTVNIWQRNAETFALEAEISKLYHSYKETKEYNKKINSAIEKALDKI